MRKWRIAYADETKPDAKLVVSPTWLTVQELNDDDWNVIVPLIDHFRFLDCLDWTGVVFSEEDEEDEDEGEYLNLEVRLRES